MRVSTFVDGFNLYHAIDELGRPHLKWLNLRLLSEVFAPSPQCTLTDVFYFTAFATWRPASYRSHREYVKALAAARVTTVLGNFKEKDRECFTCKATWKTHEEKESDVNLALCLLRGAFRDTYDRALVMTQDSDKKVANATALIWKVLMVAETRFRRLDAPHLLAQVAEGVVYADGVRVQNPRRRVAA